MTKSQPKYKVNERVYIPGIGYSGVVVSCRKAQHIRSYEYLIITHPDNKQRVLPESALKECSGT